VTILDLFDAARAERPDAPAINEVSYGRLHAGASRVARRLSELGLKRGQRLALYCENRLAFIYTYLAALRLGAIVVPVNVLYRAAELEHVLADAGVALMLTSHATHPHVPATHAAATVDALTLEGWAEDESLPGADPAHAPNADDDAVIIYTSGTTGRSKGAVLRHTNVAAIAVQVAAAWRWNARDTLYMALPFFHMHGLGAALNGTFASGGRMLFDERFDAARTLERLRGGDVTMFFGVPTMYVRLLEAAPGPVPQLRLWVSGSAALAPDVFEAFERRYGARILERYGATEFGFACSNRFGGPRVPGSVGIPTPGARVRVAGPGSLEALPPGEVGELLVGGPGVCRGYWNDDAATAAAFGVDGEQTRWYRSGDLARYDVANDVYRIVGRLKELIITGGFNVYPLEVENELDRLPGIRASAVIGVPDAARGELPVAFVEAEGEIDSEALRAALGERLASFKVPREIRTVAALPRNALGKVEKHRLRAIFAEEGPAPKK
jgi:malonyl-CoA/methylmalonyl-CoA synthetase